MMRRRSFLTLLGGAAAAWPVVVRSQSRTMVIGDLGSSSPDPKFEAAFRRGLAEQGFVEGSDFVIHEVFAHGQYDQLPGLLTDLEQRGTVVVFASGNQAALAIKAANTKFPAVFAVGDDPVTLGLGSSFNRPTPTLTGVSFYTVELLAKRLELLSPLVPKYAAIAMLANPASPQHQQQVLLIRSSAATLERRVEQFNAGTLAELESAFASIVEKQAGGFFCSTDPFFNAQRKRLIAFAARHRLPAIYAGREYIEDGGLMAYGSLRLDAYRQAGAYVGRIIKGEKPADLPVIQPTKFELLLNQKTAKAINITFSPLLLALADELIE
jgi:ABC-type uncharacterized transport system substrate-binding protein